MTRHLSLILPCWFSNCSGSLTSTILFLKILGMLVRLTSVTRWHLIHSIVVKYYMGRMALLSCFSSGLGILLDHNESTITSSVSFASRRLHEFKASGMHSVVRFLGGTWACCGACSRWLWVWNSVWYAHFRVMMLTDTVSVLIQDSWCYTRSNAIYLFDELRSLLRDRALDVESLCFMVANGVRLRRCERTVSVPIVAEVIIGRLSICELIPDGFGFLQNVLVFKLQFLNGQNWSN